MSQPWYQADYKVMKQGFETLIKEKNNSDLMDIPEYENPGNKVLRASAILCRGDWNAIDLKSFSIIIPTGGFPSNTSEQERKEILDRATIGDKICPFRVPVIWLVNKMRQLDLTDDHIQITSNHLIKFGPQASDIGLVWCEAVMKYNEYLCCIKQLQLYKCTDDDDNYDDDDNNSTVDKQADSLISDDSDDNEEEQLSDIDDEQQFSDEDSE